MAGLSSELMLRQSQSTYCPCNEKSALCTTQSAFTCNDPLHSTGDLAGAEAAGAHIDVLGGAVYDRLDALDVGLPGTVGAAVGVGNLNAEGHALTTELTFGHIYKPPRWLRIKLKDIVQYNSRE